MYSGFHCYWNEIRLHVSGYIYSFANPSSFPSDGQHFFFKLFSKEGIAGLIFQKSVQICYHIIFIVSNWLEFKRVLTEHEIINASYKFGIVVTSDLIHIFRIRKRVTKKNFRKYSHLFQNLFYYEVQIRVAI